MIGLLVSMGGSRADAEELIQEAFEKLVKSWDRLRTYDEPAAWLRTVAVRALIDRHRRTQVAKAAEPKLLQRAERHADPDAHEGRLDLDEAMAGLSVEHRAVVLLFYVHDLGVDDIATTLQVPTGTVKSRLSRARSALAQSLELQEVHDDE